VLLGTSAPAILEKNKKYIYLFKKLENKSWSS
jgi:hypothetical protein